jgi:PD-(D/E)XK endonuclease
MAQPGSGNAGEAAILAELVVRGFNVLVPFGEGRPYDLAIHLGEHQIVRVQCKTAWPRGGCLLFNSRSTDHGRGPRSYVGLADIFGVYFPPTRATYLVPIDAVAQFEGRLRLEPTLNNQRRGIRLAADFEIDRWTVDLLRGLLRSEEVRTEPELTLA